MTEPRFSLDHITTDRWHVEFPNKLSITCTTSVLMSRRRLYEKLMRTVMLRHPEELPEVPAWLRTMKQRDWWKELQSALERKKQ